MRTVTVMSDFGDDDFEKYHLQTYYKNPLREWYVNYANIIRMLRN